MKIFATDFSFQNKINFASPKAQLSFKSTIAIPVDEVVFSDSGQLQCAFSKLDKITFEEYKSLTQKEKKLLRQKADTTRIKKAVKMHEFASNCIKNFMDEKYGEGRYVVIPIGRSLSSIAKMLEFKIGKENVKNIPMSNVNELYSTNEDYSIKLFSKRAGFETFKNYLESVGLTKKEIETSGKNYVIIDYTCSGRSLNTAYNILTSDLLLGNKKGNVFKLPVHRILDRNNSQSELLDDILYSSSYKDFSFVGKTNHEFTNIFEAADYKKVFKSPHNLERIKLFGFALLDKEYGKKHKS